MSHIFAFCFASMFSVDPKLVQIVSFTSYEKFSQINFAFLRTFDFLWKGTQLQEIVLLILPETGCDIIKVLKRTKRSGSWFQKALRHEYMCLIFIAVQSGTKNAILSWLRCSVPSSAPRHTFSCFSNASSDWVCTHVSTYCQLLLSACVLFTSNISVAK